MKQEDKKLLLKDLCARLPYGVMIQEYDEEYGHADNELDSICIDYFSVKEASVGGRWINHIENVRPYLRPMSSMTEEEDKEFALLQVNTHNSGFLYAIDAANMINWLNAHHFDYCGLIEKGLALEAPEEMYEIQRKLQS